MPSQGSASVSLARLEDRSLPDELRRATRAPTESPVATQRNLPRCAQSVIQDSAEHVDGLHLPARSEVARVADGQRPGGVRRRRGIGNRG